METEKCQKCGRHTIKIRLLKRDRSTNKQWYILTCPWCDYESDIEPFYGV